MYFEVDKDVEKLQQSGKIDNLQQICGVSGCVVGDYSYIKTSLDALH